MSFSLKVKKELSEIEPKTRHCLLAELSAYVRLMRVENGEESGKKDSPLTFRSENALASQKFFTLLKKAFNISVVASREGSRISGRKGNRIEISEPDQAQTLLKATTNDTVLKMMCCRQAFLRGAFLAAGSISAPEKYYHFEIVCPDHQTADLVQGAMMSFDLDAKIVLRKGDYVVYLKEGEQIVNALGEMGASRSFLNLENIRVVKEMRGDVNRRVNCETANLNKTIVSAVRQIEDIRYIKEHGGFARLKPALRDMAEVRLDNPDVPLKDLGQYLDPPIGKSGVNHRLKKLSEFAAELREAALPE